MRRAGVVRALKIDRSFVHRRNQIGNQLLVGRRFGQDVRGQNALARALEQLVGFAPSHARVGQFGVQLLGAPPRAQQFV